MKVPTLALQIIGDSAYCGRSGCETFIGRVEGPNLMLERSGRESWVHLGPALVEGEAAFEPPVYVRKRQRHRHPAGIGILAGGVVECPGCRSREIVPPLRLTPP
jgi:hypothetical protein